MRSSATTRTAPVRSRYVVVIAVVATHVGLIAILVAASRGHPSQPVGEPPPTVVVFVPQLQVARPPPPPLRRVSAPQPDRVPVPENLPSPEVSLPVPEEDSSTAIHPDVDWYREAGRSVARVVRAEAAKRGSKVAPEEHDAPSKHPWWPKGVHQAGEEDRDPATGEALEWISDRCYVKTDAPPPGAPDFLARARISKGGCKDPSAGAARGDLFDNLPAYKKLHPDE
jgi:hypothetical protein